MLTIALALMLQAAPADCLRMAFGAYCVGGPVALLPVGSREVGGRLAWDDHTFADTYAGRVVAAERRYEPRTWLKWDGLIREIAEALGPGEDRSKFPAYADTRDSQEAAITLGRGRAAHRWAPADGLVVMMVWDQEALFVSYVATELAKAQRAKATPRF